MKNRFAALCCRCGKPVPVDEGSVMGKPGQWQVSHNSCIPVYVPKAPELEYGL